MKTYTYMAYGRKRWKVINRETKLPHSEHETKEEAAFIAASLNYALKSIELIKGLGKLNQSGVRK